MGSIRPAGDQEILRVVICGRPAEGARRVGEVLRSGKLSFMELLDHPGAQASVADLAVAAAAADVAVILVDAREDLLLQVHQHSRILALMGVRHVVLAVNGIDLLDFSDAVFKRIVQDYRAFAARLRFASLQAIPVSDLQGDNIVQSSARTPWYTGPSLSAWLEQLQVQELPLHAPAVAAAQPEVADQFEVKLLWLSEHAMAPARQYRMRLANQESTASITDIKYRDDFDDGARLAAKTLALGELGTVNLSTSAPLVFEPFAVNRSLGSFMLADKETNATVGVGIVDFALRRASNIHWQALELNKASRAEQKHQKAQCIWFTGLSGSGKSTLANALEKRLHAEGKHTYLLDGDNVRHGLNRDLGFTEADRVENIRRVAEVAKLMVDAGLIVLVSFISPFRSERRMARELFAVGEFVEVFVNTPLQECEKRDVKGLYAKARKGELKNFTGIDSPYEAPEAPEIDLQTTNSSPAEGVEQIVKKLEF